MAYRVVRFFTDLQDCNYEYHEGDNYPRFGFTPSKDRIEELSTANNRLGVPVIESVKQEKVKSEVPADAEQKYDEDTLSEMTKNEIKAIADERGYKITKMSKADVIEQFLEQQG